MGQWLFSAGFEIGDEVGEFLRWKNFVVSCGHERRAFGKNGSDEFSGDGCFGTRRGGEDNAIIGFGADDAAEIALGSGSERDGFVAADEAGAGINDGFEEIGFCSDSADSGEVGTEFTALVALLMA